MISIIIPVYNQAEHLDRCLAAIKKQTYDNYEIIIVNDGSNDNIIKVIEKYNQVFGLKLNYHDQANQGPAVARNVGAKLAKGEYLIFCDADLVMRPQMLQSMLVTLKNNPAASFCYSSFLWGSKKFILWPYDTDRLKTMPYINMASLIKKSAFPGFDETLKRFMDWDLFLTMSEQGQSGVFIDQILYQVNLGGTQTMSSWLPSFTYKLLPFLPSVKKYNQAKKIIIEKHNKKTPRP